MIFSSHHLKYLREYLEQKNFRNYYSLIDLKGFSKIRNMGLLLAQALSMDVVIFIDNDEVVEDPDYLKVACEYLNKRWNGKEVLGRVDFISIQMGRSFFLLHVSGGDFYGIRRNG